MEKCQNCNGNGEVLMDNPHYGENSALTIEPLYTAETCAFCNGTGENETRN